MMVRVLRSLLAKLLNLLGGGWGIFFPAGNYKSQQTRNLVVLAPGELPTTDFYLRGQLERQCGVPVRYVDALRTSPQALSLGEATKIVIVRHAPLGWLRWLLRNRSRLAGVVFFMDDDIPAAGRAPELPFRYAMKTAWRWVRIRHLLGRVCSEVWVSTPELASRYATASPKLLEPVYIGTMQAQGPPPVYFYHGTWAHRREIAWLVPIVRQVQTAAPSAWFEIVGNDRVKHMFRGIPRVRVIHPMPWTDYLAYTASARYAVGLAPCFDSDFNRARSHSKLFDITRLGAAGIYSNLTPYAEKVRHGETGLLCDNTPEHWVAAIQRLLNEPSLRSSMHSRALRWCAEQGEVPQFNR
jgi:glycosyltransferase involved in cell wall biosynthesis